MVNDAVILAAGGSTRMGEPKALLPVGGEPLVCAHVRAFQNVGLRVTVVLGAQAEAIAAVLPAGVNVVVNRAWATTGPAESAALGLQGLGPALLTPVDVPPANDADLRALIDASGPAVLSFDGRDGHPVRLDPPHTLLRLDVRLQLAERIPSGDADRLLNLNTPEDWAAWGVGDERPDRCPRGARRAHPRRPGGHMSKCDELLALLAASGRPYSVLEHPEARSAAAAATARGLSLSLGGKSLLLRAERVGDVVLVVGSDRRIEGRLLRRALGVQRYRFASPEELFAVTGLHHGELPAFGQPLFPAQLVVGEDFLVRDELVFAAGSACRSVRMRLADWLAVAAPRVVPTFTVMMEA